MLHDGVAAGRCGRLPERRENRPRCRRLGQRSHAPEFVDPRASWESLHEARRGIVMKTALQAALECLARGWIPLPLHPSSKKPLLPDWPRYRPTEERLLRDFTEEVNVGVLLGVPSGGLVDVDLDAPEARRLAPEFLAHTGLRSGRASSPESHFWYLADPVPKTTKWTGPTDGAVLVELRSTGAQTMFPPSIHPSGEAVVFFAYGEPARVSGSELLAPIGKLATCVLLARHWPNKGSRHAAALSAAGLLLRAGLDLEDVKHIVCRAAELAGDEEWRERGGDVETTAQRLAEGTEATGGPRLAELVGEAVVHQIERWLGVHRASRFRTGGGEAPWPRRRSLPRLEAAAPNLAPDMLPEPLRSWICDVAERFQVPLEFAAVPALVSLGMVVGRQLAVLPKQYDEWLVVPNLWGALVARPGWLKTPVIDEALRPLRKLIRPAREEYERRAQRSKAELEFVEARRSALRDDVKKAAKARAPESNLSRLKEQLRELEEEASRLEIHERRYLTNDPTVEKLAELLKHNPRGLLLMRDELAGWMRTMEKRGREGDREFYLEAWDGLQSYTVDRISRGTIYVPALCVSVFGSIQPGKLAKYVREAIEGDAGDDGLLQRFQMLVWPTLSANWENVDRPPRLDALEQVFALFERADRLDPVAVGAARLSYHELVGLHLDGAAQERFDDWFAVLERRLRSGEEQPAFESHLGKYRSLVPTLALLFQLVVVLDAQVEAGPITAPALELAIRWSQFLEPHARKIYGAGIQADLQAARVLARRIEESEVSDGTTIRSVYRRGWRHLGSLDTVEGALAVLEDFGWVRMERVATGGRPSEVLRLHPELRARSGGPRDPRKQR